jgi:hypothetical protein
MTYVGGCACGALRYESVSPPVESGYCHCRLCQRTSAAPVLVFASFPVAGFRYTSGAPTIYYSTEHGTREICPKCGTQIAYREAEGAVTVDVNAGCLDDPTTITPTHHIWCSSRIPWFETADSLPRFDAKKPDDFALG